MSWRTSFTCRRRPTDGMRTILRSLRRFATQRLAALGRGWVGCTATAPADASMGPTPREASGYGTSSRRRGQHPAHPADSWLQDSDAPLQLPDAPKNLRAQREGGRGGEGRRSRAAARPGSDGHVTADADTNHVTADATPTAGGRRTSGRESGRAGGSAGADTSDVTAI